MIHSFSVENFYSFLKKNTISFELNKHAPVDDRSFCSETGVTLSKVLSVMGANASGKTNILKALSFLFWFMKNSFQLEAIRKLPDSSHFAAPEDQPTVLKLAFEMANKHWSYSLTLNKKRVLEEFLEYKLVPDKKKLSSIVVFSRKWDDSSKSYHIDQQQTEFDFNINEAKKVRENASLISTAAQYNSPLAREIIDWINKNITNVTHFGFQKTFFNSKIVESSNFFVQNSAVREKMTSLLKRWDLGLADVQFKRLNKTDGTAEPETLSDSPLYMPEGIHVIDDKEYRLTLFNESTGTQEAFLLLRKILPVLESGGIAIMDGLETNLHPHMLGPILDLFFSPLTNPHQAQIIFTTHSPEILRRVHKAQVLLVEKDKQCNSEAWLISDIKGSRADDNFYAKYMSGTYGAIPQL